MIYVRLFSNGTSVPSSANIERSPSTKSDEAKDSPPPRLKTSCERSGNRQSVLGNVSTRRGAEMEGFARAQQAQTTFPRQKRLTCVSTCTRRADAAIRRCIERGRRSHQQAVADREEERIRSDYLTFAHKEGNRAGQRVTVSQVNKCDAESSTRIFVCARPSRRKETCRISEFLPRRQRSLALHLDKVCNGMKWPCLKCLFSTCDVRMRQRASRRSTLGECPATPEQRNDANLMSMARERTSYNKEIAHGQECFLDHQQQ